MSLSVSLDKSHPAPGEKVTMTITSDKRLTTNAFQALAGGESATVTVTVQTPVSFGPGAPAAALLSDDGKVAVYTFTV
jgi:hypothetical protein